MHLLLGLTPVQPQSRVIVFPSLTNFILVDESTHVSHVEHVSGQMDDTPSKVQRKLVDLVPAQTQVLNIRFPVEGCTVRNRYVESAQVVGVTVSSEQP